MSWLERYGSILTWQLLLRAGGWLLPVGVVAIGAALGLLFYVIPAQQDRSARQRAETQRLVAELSRPLVAVSNETNEPGKRNVEHQAAFHRSLIAAHQVPDTLRRMLGTARQAKLVIKQGEYRLTPDKDGQFARYEMSLPLQGAYPQIRDLTAQWLLDHPALALNEISFKRDGIAQTQTDARVRLTLLVEASKP